MTLGFNPKRWAILCWVPALVVVAVAVELAAAWHQLPVRIATHFDLNGVPNGWSSRSGFILAMLPMAPILALLGYLTYRIGLRRRLAGTFMLLCHFGVAGVLAYAFADTVRYNLTHQVKAPGLLLVFMFVVPMWIGALAIGIDWRWWVSRRKVVVERAPIVASETHGARAWLWLFLPVAIALLVLGFFVAGPVKFIPVIVGLLMVLAGLWAWRGFEYRFTTSYVEVRMAGIRLRRIPLQEITRYQPEDCSPLFDFGGWGIKGFANETAYIWGGHRVLRIETPRGTVFLGHKWPERLAQDLERARSSA